MSNENTTPLNAIPPQPGTPPQPTNTTTRNTASISVPEPASAKSTGETDANVNADPSADAEDQEASPPLPERHTPVTPGPRAARLQDLFATTLRHTVDKVSRDNFAACFPTVAAKAPGTLEFVQRQMVERLKGLCQKEFDNILTARNVVPKLNELEALLSDAALRKHAGGDAPIPPHTLPASAVLDAHLAPHLAAQQSQLNAKLQTVQSQNARLFDEIQAQRAEIEELLGAVERTLEDMDGASALLDEVVEELAEETRTAEMEMSGT